MIQREAIPSMPTQNQAFTQTDILLFTFQNLKEKRHKKNTFRATKNTFKSVSNIIKII